MLRTILLLFPLLCLHAKRAHTSTPTTATDEIQLQMDFLEMHENMCMGRGSYIMLEFVGLSSWSCFLWPLHFGSPNIMPSFYAPPPSSHAHSARPSSLQKIRPPLGILLSLYRCRYFKVYHYHHTALHHHHHLEKWTSLSTVNSS